jgi:VWFA-related protein
MMKRPAAPPRPKANMFAKWLRGLVPAALVAACLLAQNPPQTVDEPGATFSTGVNLVKIDVQVLDGQRLVDGLQQEDFVILDEGEPRPIEYFAHDTEPLRIVVLLDISGSMKTQLAQVAEAANKALAVLAPEDEVAVMLFARSTLVHQEFTRDRKLASEAIDDSRYEKRPGSATDINPAIIEAARYLRESGAGKLERRAIVILTDNESMSYRVPDEKVMEALYSADAVLTAMVTKSARPPAAPKPGANTDFTFANVFAWAEESGGEVLRIEKNAGETFERAIDRLRTRYSLHYRAPEANGNGRFHRIEVRLSEPARKQHGKAKLRARAGYFLGAAK